MGRICISNRTDWFEKICKINDKYFEQSYKSINKSLSVVGYNKLNISTENFYENKGDYVICSGTLFYKEEFGEKALALLLEDAKTMSVKQLRFNLLGSYGIVLKVGNTVRVFVDETHTYFLYYYKKENDILITNTYWHIANVIGTDIDDYSLLEVGVRGCIMSCNTPCSNVKKLSATECITFDIEKNTVEVVNVSLNDYTVKFESKEEAIECLYKRINEIAAIRSKYIKKYRHFLTGGIDSRLELAIHLCRKDNVSTAYWLGKDLLTNGTIEDLEIVKKISGKYSMKSECIDVAETYRETIEQLKKEKCEKYGEHASIYAGNTKLFDYFENQKEIDAFGFGYLGETLRELSELDNSYYDGFTLQDFVKNVYCRTGLEKEMFSLNGFYSYLEDELKPLYEIAVNNGSNDKKTSMFKLFSFSRFEADCTMNNFANMFVYSMPIFGQKKIADAIFSMKYEWLKNDGVSVRLIELFKKDLLDFPIYSHHRKFIYDTKKSIMNKTWKFKILDWAKPKLKDTFLYKNIYLKHMHSYIRPQSASNEEIMKICIEMEDELSILDKTSFNINNSGEWNGVDIGTIATFYAQLKVLGLALNNN